MSEQINEMNYPIERIREMRSWTYFCGFTGAVCKGCKKRANVLAGIPGWMCCLCGVFNALMETCEPFETPDHGPTRAAIQEACGVSDG